MRLESSINTLSTQAGISGLLAPRGSQLLEAKLRSQEAKNAVLLSDFFSNIMAKSLQFTAFGRIPRDMGGTGVPFTTDIDTGSINDLLSKGIGAIIDVRSGFQSIVDRVVGLFLPGKGLPKDDKGAELAELKRVTAAVVGSFANTRGQLIKQLGENKIDRERNKLLGEIKGGVDELNENQAFL